MKGLRKSNAGWCGPTQNILFGVLKPKRNSSSSRIPHVNKVFNGAKGGGFKRKRLITLPTTPFDHRADD